MTTGLKQLNFVTEPSEIIVSFFKPGIPVDYQNKFVTNKSCLQYSHFYSISVRLTTCYPERMWLGLAQHWSVRACPFCGCVRACSGVSPRLLSSGSDWTCPHRLRKPHYSDSGASLEKKIIKSMLSS